MTSEDLAMLSSGMTGTAIGTTIAHGVAVPGLGSSGLDSPSTSAASSRPDIAPLSAGPLRYLALIRRTVAGVVIDRSGEAQRFLQIETLEHVPMRSRQRRVGKGAQSRD